MKPAVRGGLVLCLSLLVTALFLGNTFGQPRPGTMVGRPPGFTGGPMGPGAMGGATGAQLGTRPGALGGATGTRIGGGVTGMGGLGGTEWVYTCTVCGKEVLRSRTYVPNVKNCCVSPRGGGGVIGVRPPPGVTNPGPPILPPVDNNPVAPPVQPVEPVLPFVPPAPPMADTSGTSTSTVAADSSSGFSGAFLVIGIGVVLFGLVVLAGVVVLVVQSQKGGAAPRRSRGRY